MSTAWQPMRMVRHSIGVSGPVSQYSSVLLDVLSRNVWWQSAFVDFCWFVSDDAVGFKYMYLLYNCGNVLFCTLRIFYKY